MKTISVFCRNDARFYDFPVGTTLAQACQQIAPALAEEIWLGKVNNQLVGLHESLHEACDVEWLTADSPWSAKAYARSLFFVLYKAVRELFPDCEVEMDLSLSQAYYCAWRGAQALTAEMVAQIKARMQALIAQDLPLVKHRAQTAQVLALLRAQGQAQKASLLETQGQLYATYYSLGETMTCFYGPLLLRTAQLAGFDVLHFEEGLLLRVPQSHQAKSNYLSEATEQDDPSTPSHQATTVHSLPPLVEQRKILSTYRKQEQWRTRFGCTTVGELNHAIAAGRSNELINVAEALQEKEIVEIATHIATQPQLRVVLIAGPSSSGKTTFSKRLSVQLRACGCRPYSISLDNYYVDRLLSPRDEKGELDFEHIEAINLPLFNAQLQSLLAGKEVELPYYDFPTGKNRPSGERLRLTDDMILILEGNHALNPRLTESIADACKYKIYASALSSVKLDQHSYISTTDLRLLRRICRDFKYRGYPPQEVIRRCPSVSEGERKWIFAFQESADVMVNTALIYEIAALRPQALPLLESIPETQPEYCEAHRLAQLVRLFTPMPMDCIPPTSLLREFLGKGSL